MDIGDIALAGSVACSLFSVVLTLPAIMPRVPDGARLSRALALASFALVTVSLMAIAWLSLSSDFRYEYVWAHSSADLDAVYRLSAVWAGGEGSLLLCAWFMSLALVAEVFFRGPARDTSEPFKIVFTSTMSLLIAFFTFTVLMSGLFKHTDPAHLTAYPDGLGMDVLLQTPEMALHAPLIFGAYASLCVVFAASASHFITGERLWSKAALPWGRLSWLLLTAGIGLGAVWAYYVIGWGGYWSWDPVETASLVPWFMITAFLHTQQKNVNDGDYRVASPLLGMLSMAGVVYVSFVVRAGGLWRSSVHDYGATSGSSAAGRFLTLLQEDPSVAGILLFLLVLLGCASYLSIRAVRKAPPSEPAKRPERLSGYISDDNNMAVSVSLLALAALIAAALMLKTMDSGFSETAAELDQKMSLLFFAVMVLMCLCMVWRLVGRDRAFVLTVALVAVSVVLGLAAAVSEAVGGMVAFALPPTVFALLVSAVRLAGSLKGGTVKNKIHRAGAQVAHIGTALLLAAFFVSSNMQSYPAEGGRVALEVGEQISVGGYMVSLEEVQVSDDVNGYPSGVVQVRTALVDIRDDDDLIADDARLEILYGSDPVTGLFVMERVAFVKSSLSEDLYMSFEWMSEDSILLHAKVVPMMLPLWTGLLLLLVGIGMRFSTAGRTP